MGGPHLVEHLLRRHLKVSPLAELRDGARLDALGLGPAERLALAEAVRFATGVPATLAEAERLLTVGDWRGLVLAALDAHAAEASPPP